MPSDNDEMDWSLDLDTNDLAVTPPSPCASPLGEGFFSADTFSSDRLSLGPLTPCLTLPYTPENVKTPSRFLTERANHTCPTCFKCIGIQGIAAYKTHVAQCFLEHRRRLPMPVRSKIAAPTTVKRNVASIRKAISELDIQQRIAMMESLRRLQDNRLATSAHATKSDEHLVSLLFTMTLPAVAAGQKEQPATTPPSRKRAKTKRQQQPQQQQQQQEEVQQQKKTKKRKLTVKQAAGAVSPGFENNCSTPTLTTITGDFTPSPVSAGKSESSARYNRVATSAEAKKHFRQLDLVGGSSGSKRKRQAVTSMHVIQALPFSPQPAESVKSRMLL